MSDPTKDCPLHQNRQPYDAPPNPLVAHVASIHSGVAQLYRMSLTKEYTFKAPYDDRDAMTLLPCEWCHVSD